MHVVAPKDQSGDDALLDVIEFGHQLGKQGLASLIEKRPPGLFAILTRNRPA